MKQITQSPTDPDFVQNPYPFYDRMRPMGPLVWWEDYAMPCAAGYAEVNALLRDRRFGREQPAELRAPVPDHQAPFYAVEDHSMLELEPPRHTRLRAQVLRAFTSRRIAGLAPEIAAITEDVLAQLTRGPVDLLTTVCQPIPVRVIARLLGVPEADAPDLLRWSNAMVGMYQAGRTRAQEDAAAEAATRFRAYILRIVEARKTAPRDDLISHLIAVQADSKLSVDEMVTTCILLLNAGHEATVHTLGNAIKTLLEQGLAPDSSSSFVEEVFRHDPPLHLFTRYALEDMEVFGHAFNRGDQVGLLLAAGNRDPAVYADPARFVPDRVGPANLSFGAGLHFCIGAPLARLEIGIILPKLWEKMPNMRLARTPNYANIYHFHGLTALHVNP